MTNNRNNKAQVTKHKIENQSISITCPQFYGLNDKTIKYNINELIKDQVYRQIPSEG